MPPKNNASSKRTLGNFGEDRACVYLTQQGYTIVERNWSCRWGEIDIIAADERYLMFVEVKLRRNAAHGRAAEFVTPAKQHRVIYAAELWLADHPTGLQPRFDVIEIYAPQGLQSGTIQINHIKDAYQL